jgi:hypothetical protein
MTDQAVPDHPNKTNEDEVNVFFKKRINPIILLLQLPPESDENEQIPVTTAEELVDYQPDEINDQLDDILPPKPKLQPIIAPDMFPPFV